MTAEISLLFSGVVLGLSGGLSPGPLLTLVVSETLKHGIREGVKVSIAPLFTDLPIIIVAIFILSSVSDILPVIGVISLCGGIFLVYLGYESIFFKGVDIDDSLAVPQSVKKGIIANFLNPSPYLFWISVGSPLVLKAWGIGFIWAFLFIGIFYLFLVGSKILVSVIIGKSRVFLKSRNYIYIIRLLGVILLVFAVLFFMEGLKNLGILSR
ncbi:MAG: LysE family translocator [Desulfobacteraceae bacterium]|nr:LysE family translocator [Desulfobacteraceae bacterium]